MGLDGSSINLIDIGYWSKFQFTKFLFKKNLKGDIEEQKEIKEEIKKLFRKINIFQPGHLAGRIDWQRKKNDPRIDVFAFEVASLFFDPFMISSLKKFRSINADKLAKFVVNKSKDKKYGINYMSYNDFIFKRNKR